MSVNENLMVRVADLPGISLDVLLVWHFVRLMIRYVVELSFSLFEELIVRNQKSFIGQS